MREAGDRVSVGDGSGLTARACAVLAVSATGLTTAEVAERLDGSSDAVRRSLAAAIMKLGARSKLEAIMIALRRGMIEVPQDPDVS